MEAGETVILDRSGAKDGDVEVKIINVYGNFIYSQRINSDERYYVHKRYYKPLKESNYENKIRIK